MTDTDKLIAQARSYRGDAEAIDLLDALAENAREREALAIRGCQIWKQRAEAAEAESQRLREALEELVRREGFTFSSWDTAAFARSVLEK